MRLWTVHPKYLDSNGLVALWREGLLAKAVLEGRTRGYRNHPQLQRFREHPQPLAFLTEYLRRVLFESRARGYHFTASKLPTRVSEVVPMTETMGQLVYEWGHLLGKLKSRDIPRYSRLVRMSTPDCHPLFTVVPGGVREWEKGHLRGEPTPR